MSGATICAAMTTITMPATGHYQKLNDICPYDTQHSAGASHRMWAIVKKIPYKHEEHILGTLKGINGDTTS